MTTAAAQPTETIRTLVMARGVQLDDDIAYALTDLRDRQEARLVAQQRTRMALRHATRVTPPPPDESISSPPPIGVSDLPKLVEWPDVLPFGEVQSPADAPPSGEFRPVQTELRSEGGLMAQNLTDGTHFYGRRKYEGDDLIRFSVGATSHFKLTPEDIPDSPTGRYRSAPPADAHGLVFGLTGHYLPVLFADDKWCHCFRVLRHALWQLVNGQWRALGERQRVDTLIHLENVVQVGTQEVHLSGFMPSPVLDFGIVDRTRPNLGAGGDPLRRRPGGRCVDHVQSGAQPGQLGGGAHVRMVGPPDLTEPPPVQSPVSGPDHDGRPEGPR